MRPASRRSASRSPPFVLEHPAKVLDRDSQALGGRGIALDHVEQPLLALRLAFAFDLVVLALAQKVEPVEDEDHHRKKSAHAERRQRFDEIEVGHRWSQSSAPSMLSASWASRPSRTPRPASATRLRTSLHRSVIRSAIR